MTLQPFSDEQLNFFKFSSLVLNEFPKALRQTFKTMWDNTYGGCPGFQLWDDSLAVRNLFATTEGGRTKVPINQSYNNWDCTNLFQATLFARSFASPASTGSSTTLSDLYVKRRAIPHGSFHAYVLSPGGNMEETFALAIDQLRLLRNSLCHSTSSEMDKLTFDQRVNYAKDAFQALGLSTAPIDSVGSLIESDFPTNEVRALETQQRDENRAYINFLKEVNSDVGEIKVILQALKAGQDQQYSPILSSMNSGVNDVKQKVEDDVANKEDITRLEKKMDELKEGQRERDAQSKNSGMSKKRTLKT